jgi:phosphatidylserine/phosphatidylglycerophosphate/cardiolipin synthase-like enzyme
LDAFKEASDRGVKIRCATNTPTSSDSFFTQVFLLNDWKKILATIPNLELYGATGERKNHGKVAVFDDRISVIGTYNLDLISSAANSEVAAIIDSPIFAAETTAAIESDYADPTVGYQQYKIAHNDQGHPIDAAGAPVLDEQDRLIGEPLTVFGPESHCTPEQLQPYEKRIQRWNWMRRNLPQLSSLRRHEG